MFSRNHPSVIGCDFVRRCHDILSFCMSKEFSNRSCCFSPTGADPSYLDFSCVCERVFFLGYVLAAAGGIVSRVDGCRGMVPNALIIILLRTRFLFFVFCSRRIGEVTRHSLLHTILPINKNKWVNRYS